ncbi:hypothetical protein IWQ57_001283 [Coemansia nantahalensis]|uniref:Uncharacterized protein n=1 Tax=Coemansia nantahalensis TaxID=2789366 RepID=A0ACC1K4I4_9FUNG|nr:hypothetical protein IWQ57_001283 [Coemansia nantahalensis]
MSATHAYFLVDAGAVADGEALLRAVTRILVFLASKHDAFTWNYEVADFRAPPRALTAAGRRRVCERKQVGAEALQGLGRALHGRQRRPRESAGAAAAASAQHAVLDTLHRRLMCLEADVEWGDPALMRSPTKAAAAGRGWTDPTRLNESMSVRSHLYIVSSCPGTPAEAEAFVCGAQPRPADEERPLLDTLTRLRDGIIGDGVWESYARKRVGVSWIRPSRRPRLCDMDAVEVLVDTVFSCCVEALGGCVMDVPSLDCDPGLLFSALFTPLHRTRTHPGWSRKLAREISAADTEPESRSWSIRVDGADPAGDIPEAVLVEAACSTRHWLADSRLLRRYNLAEMFVFTLEPQGTAKRVDGGVSYAVAVPAGASNLVALYAASADEYAQLLATVGPPLEEKAEAAATTSGADAPFSASWLEDWAQRPEHVALDISPTDGCALDVSIDDSFILEYASEAMEAAECRSELPSPEVAAVATLEAHAEEREPVTAAGHVAVSTLEGWYADMYLKAVVQPQPQLGCSAATLALLLDGPASGGGACAVFERVVGSILRTSAAIESVFECADGDESGCPFAAQRRQCAALVADDAESRRRWQLQECQLQILVHLLVADSIRKGDAEDCDERIGPLAESLYDLVDQLCIWASADDGLGTFAGASADSNAAQGTDAEYLDGASDLAVAFIGSPAVGQFSERLGEIVDELRMQCGWVPPSVGAAPSADADLRPAGRRRKGTPHKLSAEARERSEVIVGQGRRRAPSISGRRIARHLEELAGGSWARQRLRSAGPSENQPATRSGSTGSGSTDSGACSGGAESLARRPAQLKLPPHLVQQLKNEVVFTARPAPLGRAHTINGRSPGARPGALGKKATSAVGVARGAAGGGSVRARAPRRKPIPEFFDPRSSPSRSGQAREMHPGPETPATKRQRTGGPEPAGFSPSTFIATPQPPSTFIYGSDDSDDGGLERSPVFSRVAPRSARLAHEPAARRALRFPGDEDG